MWQLSYWAGWNIYHLMCWSDSARACFGVSRPARVAAMGLAASVDPTGERNGESRIGVGVSRPPARWLARMSR